MWRKGEMSQEKVRVLRVGVASTHRRSGLVGSRLGIDGSPCAECAEWERNREGVAGDITWCIWESRTFHSARSGHASMAERASWRDVSLPEMSQTVLEHWRGSICGVDGGWGQRSWRGRRLKKLRVDAHSWWSTCAREVRAPGPFGGR
jgi:hypothetical protein